MAPQPIGASAPQTAFGHRVELEGGIELVVVVNAKRRDVFAQVMGAPGETPGAPFAAGIRDLVVWAGPPGPVLYAATLTGGGVSAFTFRSDGTLAGLGAAAYPAYLASGIPPDMAVASIAGQPSLIEGCVADLTVISGQKPIVTKARKSVASFKIRDGYPIGCKVTLRRERMYEFLDRLVTIAMPRIRDFRGVSNKAFDGRGNYTLGLKDQILFPEVDYAKVDNLRGMNVTFVTTARTDEESRVLLASLGMPFRTQ